MMAVWQQHVAHPLRAWWNELPATYRQPTVWYGLGIGAALGLLLVFHQVVQEHTVSAKARYATPAEPATALASADAPREGDTAR